MKLPFMDTLGSVGLVGERKALALLFLGLDRKSTRLNSSHSH